MFRPRVRDSLGGRVSQGADRFKQLAHGRLAVMGMAASQIIADLRKIRRRGGSPADTHLGAEHLLQAGVHLFLLNKLTAIGLGNTFAH